MFNCRTKDEMLVCLKYELQFPLALHDVKMAGVVHTTELLRIRWKET